MKKRSLIWLMCSYSHLDPSTPSFEQRWWERLWDFSFWQHNGRTSIEKDSLKRDLDERGNKITVFRYVSCGGGDTWICVFTCVLQMGSCTGGQMFLYIVWTLIDSKWVSARQKRTESKGALAFVRVSLKIQSAGNETRWISNIVKTKNQSFSNSHLCITTKSWDFGQRCNFQSCTHLSNPATAHFPCHTKTPIYLSLFMSTRLLSTTASHLLTFVFPVSPKVFSFPKKKM